MSTKALQDIIKNSGVSEPAVMRVLIACGEAGIPDTSAAIKAAKAAAEKASDADAQTKAMEDAVDEGSKDLGLDKSTTTTSTAATTTAATDNKDAGGK